LAGHFIQHIGVHGFWPEKRYPTLKIAALLPDCREIAGQLPGLAFQLLIEMKATGAFKAMPGKKPKQAKAGTGDNTIEFGYAHGAADFGGIA
jgi:hypothetical protein